MYRDRGCRIGKADRSGLITFYEHPAGRRKLTLTNPGVNQRGGATGCAEESGTPALHPAEYQPIPGPSSRESFFAVQQRQQRARWLYAVLAVLTVIVTGIPLSIALAPMLYVAIFPIATIMVAWYPHSLVWGLLRYGVPFMIPVLAITMFSSLDYSVHQSATGMTEVHGNFHTGTGSTAPPDPWTDPVTRHGTMPGFGPALLLAAVLLALPGSVLLLAIWYVVRRVFHRAGVGGVLLALGARPPDGERLEEQRLVDAVQEMAVAAALPAPRVMIIDRDVAGDAANAAAIGSSIFDATIIVTRPLLEDLTRDQTQAVIACVVASIGNGDLRIAFLLLSMFETLGLARLAIHGTHRSDARRTLARFVRLGMRPAWAKQTETARKAEEQAVMALVARAAGTPPAAPAGAVVRAAKRALGWLFTPVLIPLNWMARTIGVIVALSARFFAGPVIAAMWRRRQMLADAMAVQLTRNPDALAGALLRMDDVGVVVPHASAVSHLFAAWPPGAPSEVTGEDPSDADILARKMSVPLSRRIAALKAMGASATIGESKGGGIAGWTRALDSAAGVVGAMAAVPVAAVVLAIDLALMGITLGVAGGLMYLVAGHSPSG
jgi:Zn-dependent protease with chaperone function